MGAHDRRDCNTFQIFPQPAFITPWDYPSFKHFDNLQRRRATAGRGSLDIVATIAYLPALFRTEENLCKSRF